ncbi:MAG TPA: T9SS type A sorting domain-containing protein [Chitinophagaceae bacterium]|nr:T9SS type A sorting domain-containing protein [Chitinophagaceae bacterium]
MKKVVPILILLLLYICKGYTQITSPVIRANFGVDADMRSNFFNGFVQSGNDDWFVLPGSLGTGQFMIDTAGAAARVARYAIDVPFRRSTFVKMMRFPVFSVINNRLLLDAAFIRDYHGDDSTVFASGSSKNGDNPTDWNTPVSQGIPDKNDILDVMVHIRRAGPNITDSLWMMGGMSLDNTTGDRYFDFEMYQTDLAYNRSTLKFTGAGPDAGHTSWQFDAAGNIIKAGDIIFSAEYQSSSLTFIEARIWINQASLSISPAAFAWSGQFDGASSGATFGYASIQPKGAGTYYSGLQCANNTWGGPFSIILQNDVIATNYTAKQYVEFSVNLTKLGLDPVTSISGDPCGMPFRRLLVKTRASASFTAQLKDFVAPTAMFIAPRADITTETPSICSSGSLAEIYVTNPVATSTYQWTTPNGNIVSSPTGPFIFVDKPGTYIVTQYLMTGCTAYARDTIQVTLSSGCIVLPAELTDLRGTFKDGWAQLNWKTLNNQDVEHFLVQRSEDGTNFTTVGQVDKQGSSGMASYSFTEDVSKINGQRVYYRVVLVTTGHAIKYSNVIFLSMTSMTHNKITIFPNPARDIVQLQLAVSSNSTIKIDIFDAAGRLVATRHTVVYRGNNVVTIEDLADRPRGMYTIRVNTGEESFKQKLLLVK